MAIATYLALKSLFQQFAANEMVLASTPKAGALVTIVVFGVGTFFIAHSLFSALSPHY